MSMPMIVILKKELSSIAYNPLGWIVMITYIILSMISTLYGSNYFNNCNQNILIFFQAQPEIFLLIIPAIGINIWSAEKKGRTLELLLSQPISFQAMVLGKFFAFWIFCLLMLLPCIGLWITTGLLTNISLSMITINILAYTLAAGAFCALSLSVSFLASGTVAAFILALIACIFIKIINFTWIFELLNISGEIFTKVGQSLNFDYHFNSLLFGRLGFDNISYFITIIIFSLWFNINALAAGRR